jgi:hypothetical protein
MRIIVFIRDSQYGMPIAQSVHLVGLSCCASQSSDDSFSVPPCR